MPHLSYLELTLLGGLGGITKEGAVIVAHISRTGRGPWRPRKGRRPPGTDETTPRVGFYVLALVLRVFIALSVVWVLALIEAASPIAAFLIGANATRWLELASSQISLPNGQVVPQIELPQPPDAQVDSRPAGAVAPTVVPVDSQEATS